MTTNKNFSLKGTITVPGDKSISHRSVMIGSISRGITVVKNFLNGEDCNTTIQCFQSLGITIEHQAGSSDVTIYGNGIHGLGAPEGPLPMNNSGTSMRLIAGILSGQNFYAILNGDASLRKRPMDRIIKPLLEMNAEIRSGYNEIYPPLVINDSCMKGNDKSFNLMKENHPILKSIHYNSPIASAQVKSCILLAGIYADGITSVTEPYASRNHTELMLQAFGADIKTEGTTTSIKAAPNLRAREIFVPGDISSAAYFIVACLIVPNSELVLKDVGINPTRDGILEVCKAMGADIKVENVRSVNGELMADLIVHSSPLKGTTIGGAIIPRLIDEIPILAVLACFADGETIIKDASELKVKESNRIDLMVRNLQTMGADIEATEDGMIIRGGKPLHGGIIQTKLDHRIAMSFGVANLMCDGDVTLDDRNCVDISYPGFFEDLNSIIVKG